ncbi:MAG: hypothetical protein AAF629_18845 [Chloroflexota bacterium]
MALEYPDVIGDYVAAPQRFEVNGLQYVGHFEPITINHGEVTQFSLWLQNTVNTKLDITLKFDLPQSGRFRGQPVLKTNKTEFEVSLAEAEVSRLMVPLTTTDKVADGKYSLSVEVKVQHEKGAKQIRSPRSKPVKIPYLDNMVGLDLVGVLGTTYSTKGGKKSSFDVNLTKEQSEVSEIPSLAPDFQSVWTLEFAELMEKAQRIVNETRVKIVDDLQIEPLYAALFAENTERFADAGLPLRIGEAIAIAKLLTYTVHFFLGQGGLQNGLLCPIWTRAIINEITDAQTIEIMKYAGYKHIVRLAAALSFGLVAESTGKHLWTQHERQEVSTYIADALDEGDSIPPDFLYLPLMLGALRIVEKVRLPGEDVKQTLQLIQAARQERPDVFVDEDMANARQVFDHLLKKAVG